MGGDGRTDLALTGSRDDSSVPLYTVPSPPVAITRKHAELVNSPNRARNVATHDAHESRALQNSNSSTNEQNFAT
jgi:hypothetical protein